MRLVTISGTYRKGKTIDTLIDRAVEGVRASCDAVELDQIRLIDRNIEYCRNCMACRNDDPGKRLARCIIDDDMQDIYRTLDEAEALVLGTPVNMGYATAVTKTFLERCAWVLARPGKRPIKGCPEPRVRRGAKALAIVSSGLVPPLLRRWCDEATPQLKELCVYHGSRLVGSLYAGAVERRGVDAYRDAAFRLGARLV